MDLHVPITIAADGVAVAGEDPKFICFVGTLKQVLVLSKNFHRAHSANFPCDTPDHDLNSGSA